MVFDIKEWPCNERVGKAYGFEHHGKFHGILRRKRDPTGATTSTPTDSTHFFFKGKLNIFWWKKGLKRLSP